MSAKIKIIYLLGSGHCGSTLLDLIMDGHSKIVGVGELENIPLEPNKQQEIKCACGGFMADCGFWKRITIGLSKYKYNNLKVYQTKFSFLMGRKNFYNIKTKQPINKKDYLELNKYIYKKIKEISGKEVIFDSSKGPDRVELLSCDSGFDIMIIHLVREGRGVTWSYQKKYGNFLNAALRWALSNIKIEIFKKRYKNLKQLLIGYEDLACQPEQTIKQILNWIGLEMEPQILNFRQSKHHQVAGNRMRLYGPSEIKEDLSWQNNLSKKQIFVFNILFGWLNRFYNFKQ